MRGWDSSVSQGLLVVNEFRVRGISVDSHSVFDKYLTRPRAMKKGFQRPFSDVP